MQKNTSVRADQSFTKVQPDLIIQACTRFLESKLVEMQQLQEPRIQKEMKGGIFKPKETREAVIERLWGKLWTDYALIRLSGEYSVKRAEELISLAKFAKLNDESVYLYAEDAKLFDNYL